MLLYLFLKIYVHKLNDNINDNYNINYILQHYVHEQMGTFIQSYQKCEITSKLKLYKCYI